MKTWDSILLKCKNNASFNWIKPDRTKVEILNLRTKIYIAKMTTGICLRFYNAALQKQPLIFLPGVTARQAGTLVSY